MTLTAKQVLAGVILVSAGCAVRQPGPKTYRVVPLGRRHVLLPPGAAAAPSLQVIRLDQARAKAFRGGCDAEAGPARLKWRGRTALVEIRPEGLSEGADVATTVTGAGAPAQLSAQMLYDSSWIAKLRDDLRRREGQCLDAGAADRVVQALIENMAVESSHAFYLRRGDYRQTGWFDVEPPYVLRSVTPLLKPGVARYVLAADVRGYETAVYRVRPRTGGGIQVGLEHAEQNERGVVRRVARPSVELLSLPGEARYVRLFFRTWRVGTDRRIALLASATRDDLERATAGFERDPEGFCAGASRLAACISVPREMVISAELRVQTNHGNLLIPVGGTVGDVLRAAGVKDPPVALKSLEITRLFQGRPASVEFDRGQGTVLGLVLLGGERIRW